MIFQKSIKRKKKVDFVNEINLKKMINALVNNLLYPKRGTSRSNDAAVWHLIVF